MPEKIRSRGCGKRCIRCWKNYIKHGNKLKKSHKNLCKVSKDNQNVENDLVPSNDITDNYTEYFNLCIRINNKGYRFDWRTLNIFKLCVPINDIYEDYIYWLSVNKNLYVKKKEFIKQLCKHFPKYITKHKKYCHVEFIPYYGQIDQNLK
jgi:hypothetical protein